MEIERSVDELINPAITSAEKLEELMSTPGWTVEKVASDETAVGIVVAEEKSSEHVYLSDLAIDPKAHGRGYGRAALAEFLKRHRSVRRIDLMTHEENRRALALYAKFGFERERVVPNAFGNGLDFLLLSKTAS